MLRFSEPSRVGIEAALSKAYNALIASPALAVTEAAGVIERKELLATGWRVGFGGVKKAGWENELFAWLKAPGQCIGSNVSNAELM